MYAGAGKAGIGRDALSRRFLKVVTPSGLTTSTLSLCTARDKYEQQREEVLVEMNEPVSTSTTVSFKRYGGNAARTMNGTSDQHRRSSRFSSRRSRAT